MKIYVAAKFEDQERVRALYEALKAAGHENTYDWTRAGAVSDDDPRGVVVSQDEIAAVHAADVFAILPHERSKGAYVELGVALAGRKPVFVIDPGAVSKKWSVFFHHPRVRYVHDEKELIARLKMLEIAHAA